MNHPPDRPTLGQPAAALAAGLAVLVLWGSRGVMTLDVVVRMLLPVGWIVLWTLACLGAGWAALALLTRPGAPLRRPFVVLAMTGAAVLALIGVALALAGMLRPVWLSGLAAVSAALGLWVAVRHRRRIEWVPEGLISPLGIAFMLPAGAALLLTSTPPVMYDVLHYHLAFPDQWLMAGEFVEFPRQSFAYYFSAQGMLFAVPLATIGPWAANAVGWWMAAMATLSAATLGQRLGGREAAPWAAGCYALTPAVLETVTYANTDHGVAAWAGAAMVVLVDTDDRHRLVRRLGLIGFLVGTAAAAKYLAMVSVAVPAAAATGIWVLRSRGRRHIHGALLLAAFAAGAVLPVAPWAARNVAWTGNPVYPYFTEALGGPPSGLTLETETRRTLDHPQTAAGTLMAGSAALAIRTFKPRAEGGLLGPHWLILLPIGLGVGGLARRLKPPLWTAVLIGLLGWGFLVQYVRFLFPTLVWAAALAGVVPPALTRRLSPVTRRIVMLLLLAIFTWNASSLLNRFNIDRLATVAGVLDDRDYRVRWNDSAPAADFVAHSLPADARVLMVAEARAFGLERPVVVEDPYRTPLLVDLAEQAPNLEALVDSVRQRGITHCLVNEGEMDRMAGVRGAPDYWSPASTRARTLISAFLDQRLIRLFEHDGVWVAELGALPADEHESPDANGDQR